MATASRVAVMQPYLFPYLGYWQMMHAVDTFIVYDDVQYTRGWMNRNRYRDGASARWMTVPVAHGSLRTTILERRLAADFERYREAILSKLENAYRDAPYFDQGIALARSGLTGGEGGGLLLDLLLHSMASVRELLGISTQLRLASQVEYDRTLPREERLIELCLAAGGATYYSLSGGRKLYSPERFAERGLALRFREFDETRESGTGEHALSIIDLVMRYDVPQIRGLLASAQWSGEDRGARRDLPSEG